MTELKRKLNKEDQSERLEKQKEAVSNPTESPYNQKEYAEAIQKAVESNSWQWFEETIEKSLYAQIVDDEAQMTSANIIEKLKAQEKSKQKQEKSKSRKQKEQQEKGNNTYEYKPY